MSRLVHVGNTEASSPTAYIAKGAHTYCNTTAMDIGMRYNKVSANSMITMNVVSR
jgi:hypothetical protein